MCSCAALLLTCSIRRAPLACPHASVSAVMSSKRAHNDDAAAASAGAVATPTLTLTSTSSDASASKKQRKECGAAAASSTPLAVASSAAAASADSDPMSDTSDGGPASAARPAGPAATAKSRVLARLKAFTDQPPLDPNTLDVSDVAGISAAASANGYKFQGLWLVYYSIMLFFAHRSKAFKVTEEQLSDVDITMAVQPAAPAPAAAAAAAAVAAPPSVSHTSLLQLKYYALNSHPASMSNAIGHQLLYFMHLEADTATVDGSVLFLFHTTAKVAESVTELQVRLREVAVPAQHRFVPPVVAENDYRYFFEWLLADQARVRANHFSSPQLEEHLARFATPEQRLERLTCDTVMLELANLSIDKRLSLLGGKDELELEQIRGQLSDLQSDNEHLLKDVRSARQKLRSDISSQQKHDADRAQRYAGRAAATAAAPAQPARRSTRERVTTQTPEQQHQEFLTLRDEVTDHLRLVSDSSASLVEALQAAGSVLLPKQRAQGYIGVQQHELGHVFQRFDRIRFRDGIWNWHQLRTHIQSALQQHAAGTDAWLAVSRGSLQPTDVVLSFYTRMYEWCAGMTMPQQEADSASAPAAAQRYDRSASFQTFHAFTQRFLLQARDTTWLEARLVQARLLDSAISAQDTKAYELYLALVKDWATAVLDVLSSPDVDRVALCAMTSGLVARLNFAYGKLPGPHASQRKNKRLEEMARDALAALQDGHLSEAQLQRIILEPISKMTRRHAKKLDRLRGKGGHQDASDSDSAADDGDAAE